MTLIPLLITKKINSSQVNFIILEIRLYCILFANLSYIIVKSKCNPLKKPDVVLNYICEVMGPRSLGLKWEIKT